MRIQDVLMLGFRPLTQRKTRAALTILMIVVGITAIVALTSQTAGISDSITSSLSTLGPTTILVTPTPPTPGESVGHLLTQADTIQIASLPGVATVIPVVQEEVSIQDAGQQISATVIGTSSQGLESLVGTVNFLTGSTYEDANVPDALLGYRVAYPTSGPPTATAVGQLLIVQQATPTGARSLTFQVGGILANSSSSPLMTVSTRIFLPLEATMNLFNAKSYSMLLVKAVDTNSVESVVSLLSNVYGNNAKIVSLQQITQTVSGVISTIGLLFESIAGISLTVAGVGIANVMLISVYERTREIGIIKSLGFKDGGVLSIFLAEAAIIGLVGGVTGLLVGTGVSYVLPTLFSELGSSGSEGSNSGASGGGGGFGGGGPGSGGSPGGGFLSYTPVITPEIVVVSLLTALAVSTVAGLYPAWKAARMQPIKALRYE